MVPIPWQTAWMTKGRSIREPRKSPGFGAESPAPITMMMSSRLIVLANLLRRGALLRYKRLAGLSSVEFGLVACLGRHAPMSVASLAAAVGMDKGQISRALAGLVTRKLIAKQVNARDSREVLVSLTKTGLAAHDRIVAGAIERQKYLLQGIDAVHAQRLLDDIERLTERADEMLAVERGLKS